MPQKRKPIAKCPPGWKLLLGTFNLAGANGLVITSEKHFVQRQVMLEAANRFLEPYGDDLLPEVPRSLLSVVLVGDCFEIALDSSILVDGKHPGTVKRFVALLAREPDFALKYLICLREAGAKAHESEFARAVDALRNLETVRCGDGKLIPASQANDKDFAAHLGVHVNTLHNARTALNHFDSAHTVMPKPRKPATKHNHTRSKQACGLKKLR